MKEMIYKLYEGHEAPRPHLGASIIGRECERSIWYSFRWAKKNIFKGRMLRLFERGKREEAVVIDELRQLGYEIEERGKDGKQIGFKDGHFAGSIDAMGKDQDGYFIVEIKTANERSFADLERHGVQKSKPEHYCQMQVYMGKMKVARALYICVCKNDDNLHIEYVPFDLAAYNAICQRAKEIIYSQSAPERLSENPAYFKCKMCEYHGICHGGEEPEMNCRTCKSLEPLEDGTWFCRKKQVVRGYSEQISGCSDHEVWE